MAKTKHCKKRTRTGSYDIVVREGRPRRFRGTLRKPFNLGKTRLANLTAQGR